MNASPQLAQDVRAAFAAVPRVKPTWTDRHMKILVVGESGLGKCVRCFHTSRAAQIMSVTLLELLWPDAFSAAHIMSLMLWSCTPKLVVIPALYPPFDELLGAISYSSGSLIFIVVPAYQMFVQDDIHPEPAGTLRAAARPGGQRRHWPPGPEDVPGHPREDGDCGGGAGQQLPHQFPLQRPGHPRCGRLRRKGSARVRFCLRSMWLQKWQLYLCTQLSI